MAESAVTKIKEAEDQIAEQVRRAAEEARRMQARAEETAAQRYREILEEAMRIRDERIQNALQKARIDCEILTKQGEQECAKILAPEPERFERAVRFVMERIVN